MLRSMTGYGEAAAQGRAFVLTVEVKSVNNRFLKVGCKVPEEISFVQNEVEERIKKALIRGSVFVTVRFAPNTQAGLYEIDVEVLKKYLKTLDEFQKEIGRAEAIEIRDLLPLPGVVHSEDSPQFGREEVIPVLSRALDEALQKLIGMRVEEGSRLDAEFRLRQDLLRGLLGRVEKLAPKAVEEYRDKLEDRVNLLLSQKGVALSAPDILKEVALLAERSDITEEITRFGSHLAQFSNTLDAPEAIGRKLEFLVQELMRESNTMGAKSSNSVLNEIIVEIKAEVDRLREQVANVE